MSKSSKTLKPADFPALVEAQKQAVKMRRMEWIQWMRATYSYHLAVKMARHLGFSSPGLLFYQSMRSQGIILNQLPHPSSIRWGLVSDADPLS